MRFRIPFAVALSAAIGFAGVGVGVAAASASPAAARVSACTASELGVWVAVDQGNGAAGSIYYPLQFTNLSRHACTLYGFPGVSATGLADRQLGSPASWNHVSAPHTVLLGVGATAHAILRWSGAEVTTAPGCHPAFAVGLRVYPPDQRSSTDAAFSVEACSHAGPVYLSVGPIIAGVGTING